MQKKKVAAEAEYKELYTGFQRTADPELYNLVSATEQEVQELESAILSHSEGEAYKRAQLKQALWEKISFGGHSPTPYLTALNEFIGALKNGKEVDAAASLVEHILDTGVRIFYNVDACDARARAMGRLVSSFVKFGFSRGEAVQFALEEFKKLPFDPAKGFPSLG